MQTNNQDNVWRRFFSFGGYATILFIFMVIFDMILGIISGGQVDGFQTSSINRFERLNQNIWLGLYQLDLLNVISQLISIPIYLSLYAALKQTNLPGSLFSLILFLIGTTIFVANNVALPMLDLSRKYFAAPEPQRSLLVAAGEALLARGAHGSPGAFFSFLLPTIAALMFSIVMLQGNAFSKPNAFLGIFGNILMLFYIYFVTFIPELKELAIMLVMPAGLLLLGWLILIGIRLLKLGNSANHP